jgi:hypothetical protein
MKQIINSILSDNKNHHFKFFSKHEKPTAHLKEVTKDLTNNSGLYLVFIEKNIYDKRDFHLNFDINNMLYSLIYFGKAGGISKSGKVITQGLRGRINNVISDSTRGLKDVKRAIYWNQVLIELNSESLDIFCIEHINPSEIEEKLYDFLDKSNLKYPILNKKRGRTKSEK